MPDIREPVGVDSPGKLNEWLSECGMPEHTGWSLDDFEIWWETCGLGFNFPRGDRDAANAGYRELCRYVAAAFWEKLQDKRVLAILWRTRPEFHEDRTVLKLVNADGSDCQVDDEADEIPPGAYSVDSGFSGGRFYCRFALVLRKI